EIDLGFLPLGHGDGSRDRDFALDFLLVKIRDRVALIDTEKAVGRSGGEQQTCGERCLAGIAVAHYTDVPDILAFVDLHGIALVSKRNSNMTHAAQSEPRPCLPAMVGHALACRRPLVGCILSPL